jgi:molecular chaperone HtpG
VPSKLLDRLSEDGRACVANTIRDFSPLFQRNRMVFFPAFTDHGVAHIEETLQTALELIPQASLDLLTSDDIVVLVLAVVLHDSAMHLSEAGFVELLQNPGPVWPELGDRAWPELWEQYLAEAQRWDERTLVRLFGNADAAPRVPDLGSAGSLSTRDHLLIGEFLRRHHARLAHQVALSGFPGPDGERLEVTTTSDQMADLAGAVARSHGLPLRAMVDYLRSRYRLPVYGGIHAVYLMAVLRVADYIQIHPARAPRQYRMVYRIESGESRQEWDAHAAITEISAVHDDPEALYVEAVPADLRTFLRVRHWLSGIQAELDLSWAVLGEVYGRFTREGLHELGLTLRRVRSNLETTDGRPRAFDFIPREARFAAADAELLDLLVIPLYGNRPEIGIRELCQNAVDAVRERREYHARRGGSGATDPDEAPDVRITLREEGGAYTLEIADRGIGMTPEVVIQYFLRAGASFRRSSAWKQMFEDEAGHSRVLRLGRFGVGALAGFLLGPRIHVTTRYVGDPEGVRFSASLADEVIEMRRAPGLPVGTTITISVSRAKGEALAGAPESWNWYHLETPSLSRRIVRGAGETELEPGPRLPSPERPLPPDWRRMQVPGLGEVHWSHGPAPYLCCNGIHVAPRRPRRDDAAVDTFSRLRVWEGGPAFVAPNLSVFDADGRLPLTLQRDALAEPLPFVDALVDSVLRDFVAFLLVHAPRGPVHDPAWFGRYQSTGYPGLEPKRLPLWFSTPDGVAPLTPWHFVRAAPKDVVILPHTSRRTQLPALHLSRAVCTVSAPLPEVYDHLVEFLGRLSGDPHRAFRQPVNEILERFRMTGARLFMPMTFLERGERPHAWITIRNRATVELRTRDWVVWRFGSAPDAAVDYMRLADDAPHVAGDLQGSWSGIVAEWYYASSTGDADPSPALVPPPPGVVPPFGTFPSPGPARPPAGPHLPPRLDSPFVDRWTELTGAEVMPFQAGERRRVLSHAFETLASDVAVQEPHPAIPSAAVPTGESPAPRPFGPTIQQRVAWEAERVGLAPERMRLEHVADPSGRANRSFRATDGSRSLHLKLAREPAVREGLRRFWSLREILRARYHAPPALAWMETPEPEYAGVLSAWIDGGVPAVLHRSMADEVVLCIHRLHHDAEVAASLPAPPEPATCADFYLRTRGARFRERLERIARTAPPFMTARLHAWMHAEAAALEAEVAADPAFAAPANTPIHGDLSPRNLLVTEKDQAWYLVDWDGLALGDPALDWATLFGPSPESLDVAIQRQLPPPVTTDPGVRARLPLHARASLLDLVIGAVWDWSDTPYYLTKARSDFEAVHRGALTAYRARYRDAAQDGGDPVPAESRKG